MINLVCFEIFLCARQWTRCLRVPLHAQRNNNLSWFIHLLNKYNFIYFYMSEPILSTCDKLVHQKDNNLVHLEFTLLTEQIEITQCARSCKFFKKGRNEKRKWKKKRVKQKVKRKCSRVQGNQKNGVGEGADIFNCIVRIDII